MRIARFSIDGNVAFGVIEGDPADPESLVVNAIAGHPFGEFKRSELRQPLTAVRLLAPVLPSKIVAIGRNYAEHIAELGVAEGQPKSPVVFFKPSTSVVGPGDPISYPSFSNEVHHEAELAVVIGRMCRDVPASSVHAVILGYTCANDVTARDVQRAEDQWSRAKGFDSACPLGPWVETEVDPADLAITCTVNGELRQAGRTGQMLRSVADLIVHVSQSMTLLPGDVVLTGTPAGVGALHVGDEVAVSIEGIGTLTNRVVKS